LEPRRDGTWLPSDKWESWQTRAGAEEGSVYAQKKTENKVAGRTRLSHEGTNKGVEGRNILKQEKLILEITEGIEKKAGLNNKGKTRVQGEKYRERRPPERRFTQNMEEKTKKPFRAR